MSNSDEKSNKTWTILIWIIVIGGIFWGISKNVDEIFESDYPEDNIFGFIIFLVILTAAGVYLFIKKT